MPAKLSYLKITFPVFLLTAQKENIKYEKYEKYEKAMHELSQIKQL